MKKIVAVMLAGALFAGAASADVSFSYTGYNYLKSSGGNLDLATDDHSDCMSVALSKDTSGVVLDIDTDYASADSSSNLVLDKYYAWLVVKGVKFTAGKFNSRFTNRLNQDAGDLDSADFEMFKYGVVGSTRGVGTDSNNIGFNKAVTTLADKTFAINDATLLVKGGIFNSNWTPTAASDELQVKSGFALELAYQMPKVATVDFVARSWDAKTNSFSVFVAPVLSEKLQLVAGATFDMFSYYKATSKTDTKIEEKDSATEFAFDLRARYKYSDKITFTTMHNISSYVPALLDKDNGGVEYAEKYADSVMGLWDMFNVSFVFADNMNLGCTVNSYIADLDKDDFYIDRVIFTPYLQIAATPSANVTVALRGSFSHVDPTFKSGEETLDITIPVTVSFSL